MPNLLEWSNTLPSLTTLELTQRLPVSVPPSTLLKELLAEAHAQDAFPAFARSLLVRLLRENANASGWLAVLDPDQRETAVLIWARVQQERAAHPDWLPETGEDPRIIKVFSAFDFRRSARVARVASVFERLNELPKESPAERVTRLQNDFPRGFAWVNAMRRVDAEVRSGGFAAFYANGGEAIAQDAVEGFRAAHCKAAEVVRDSVHERQADEPRWPRLDEAYLALELDVFALTGTLVDEQPVLFDTPFEELHHADGRVWRVRTSGSRLELEIVVGKDEPFTRTRHLDSPAAARAEAARLVEEQLQDGFRRPTSA